MSDKKLLPCPGCGNDAVKPEKKTFGVKQFWLVMCGKCDSRIAVLRFTKAEAIDRWNELCGQADGDAE